MINSRQRFSLNKDWSFFKGDLPEFKFISHGDIYNRSKAGANLGPPSNKFDARSWRMLNLPHDFIIEQDEDKKTAADWGYKPKGNAWYRKCFAIEDKFKGSRVEINFEGVATEATIYFNGSLIKRNFSGYTSFKIDVTDRVIFGGVPNVLAVYVNATAFEGWWYEGGGIYRSVWLDFLPPVHFSQVPHIKCTNTSDQNWTVDVSGTISGKCTGKSIKVKKIIFDKLGNAIADFFEQSTTLSNPELWDIDSPILYSMSSELYVDDVLVDRVQSDFGFRTISISADKGFFLNGKNVKLHGTCNHQDFVGIGTAVPDSIWEYKIQRLKDMGCNAYRSAHGMASEGLIKACDRLGMLVMDENRNFETSDDCLEQLKTMIIRDRNHPSIVFYSIFNEEPIQSTEQGRNMAVHMLEEIRKLDDSRFVTGAMHGGILEDNGVGNCLDMVGINYQLNSFDAFHEKFPHVPMISTESTSSFQTRGCHVTDDKKHTFSCYDEDAADWGNTIRDTWATLEPKEFVMGAFMWTGFDYLGEPSPYVYPSVSSFFGLMDTCGFEKGGYYLAKALWSKVPYVYMLPEHWNFNAGDTVKIMSCTNCEEAELFINNISYGRVSIELYKQHTWEVAFEEGEIKIVGYNNNAEVGVCVKQTAKSISEFKLTPCFDKFDSQHTVIPVIVEAVDENNVLIPDACNALKITMSGGKILGTGNGNPNCHESFVGNKRSLFAGKAMIIVAANDNAENVLIKVKADNIKQCRVTIPIEKSTEIPFVPTINEIYITDWKMAVTVERPNPIESVSNSDMNSFMPVNILEGCPSELCNKNNCYALFRTSFDIPEQINGNAPVLHFNQLWGKGEIYVNDELKEDFNFDWACELDLPLDCGSAEVTVLVQSLSDYGAGICSAVILR